MGFNGTYSSRIPTLIIRLTFISLILILFPSKEQATLVERNPTTRTIIPDLPVTHYQFWLRNHRTSLSEFQSICSQISNLPGQIETKHFKDLHKNLYFENNDYLFGTKIHILRAICSKISLIDKSCWGYENNCQEIYIMPECNGSHLGEAKDDQDQKIKWFNQADFGYILERRREMMKYCAPYPQSNSTKMSSLECTKYFRSCRGRNLWIRFRGVPKRSNLTKHAEGTFLRKGDIGGWNCDLQEKRIPEESGQSGSLQSWYTELQHYKLLPGEQSSESCSLNISKPTYIVKLDSPHNFYHHICTFLNLYATMHLNGRFQADNQIIVWGNIDLPSKLNKIWKAFTRNEVQTIDKFEGRQVCFDNYMFAFPPRMIDGLFYNTHLIPGCRKSGLFHAFNRHLLHRLNITQKYDLKTHLRSNNKRIKVVIIERMSQYRQIINIKPLEDEVKTITNVDIDLMVTELGDKDFIQQLEIVQNADILVGIHGAGLTHTLFLPDWAAVIEIHKCGDECYSDLARLRGIDHFTLNSGVVKVQLSDHNLVEKLKQKGLYNHDKYSNYHVNPDSFVDKLKLVIEKVQKNREKYFHHTKVDSQNDFSNNSNLKFTDAGSLALEKRVKKVEHEEL